jgi:hypothetical protein
MTTDAAALAVIIALMVGYYFARWRRAETSLKTNKAFAEASGKAAWRARGGCCLWGQRCGQSSMRGSAAKGGDVTHRPHAVVGSNLVTSRP